MTPRRWFYVTGAVWTTPKGPDDGGLCVATRSSLSALAPWEKDEAMRLCAAAPDLLAATRAALDALSNPDLDDFDALALERQLRLAIARAVPPELPGVPA